MSRTKRRAKGADQYLMQNYVDGPWSLKRHARTKQYRNMWWLEWHASKKGLTIEQTIAHRKAWFHMCGKSGVWNEVHHYGRRWERAYRHASRVLLEKNCLNDEVYDLPLKARNFAHLYWY